MHETGTKPSISPLKHYQW